MANLPCKEISLDELPQYTPWPARLLSLEPWGQREKTPNEIKREYDREKWGGLLRRASAHQSKLSVDEVDAWYLEGMDKCAVLDQGRLMVFSALDALSMYKRTVAKAIEPFLPAPALVELGTGYGSVLYDLARQPSFLGMQIVGGEYTASGLELLRRLSTDGDLLHSSGRCDLGAETITDFSIPEGAIIYTSLAMCYLPVANTQVLDNLANLSPKTVIHLEPCYEHFTIDSLLGLMQRRYVELNNYNTNLLSILHKHQDDVKIDILAEKPQVFGMNPFLPVSVLAWQPKGSN